MDFGNFPGLRDPTAFISSDALVYRYHPEHGGIQVLTGIRQEEPWSDYMTVPFGGYINPEDTNPPVAAKRELLEETGLVTEISHVIGIYGPERWHHRLVYNSGSLKAIKTNRPAHIRPVVTCVFAAKVTGGELTESSEQKELSWKNPIEVVRYSLAFDHALVLRDFFLMERHPVLREDARLMLRFFR